MNSPAEFFRDFEPTNTSLPLFVLSDGTGETAENLVDAILTQYYGLKVEVYRYKMVRTEAHVKSVIEEAKLRNAPLIYTVVSPEVRVALSKGIKEAGIKAVDVLGETLDLISSVYNAKPSLTPGLLHQVDEKYYRRIEAIEFAVKQDDGSLPENLKQADLVLVGVSRTSKTPLSIFLSHKGYKVANVPLVMGIEVPKELFEIDQNKIVALTIDPEALTKIRRERLVRLGRDPVGDYASSSRVREEIEWALKLFSRNKRWPVFEVSNKALEETAAEIERRMRSRLKHIKSDFRSAS
jgi:regulator of PEP synthase PpsR (kinase-PPPase family)